MKIDQTTGAAVPFRLPPSGRRAAPLPAPDAEASPVEAGGSARQLSGQDSGGFDVAKVAAIKEDIRTGRYKVNPERIADGLLASLRELMSPK